MFTKRARTILFGLLVVLSAIAQTSFSNLIAYEAFDLNLATSSVNVRSMNNFRLVNPDGESQYDFSDDQQTSFKLQVTTMVLGLSFESAAKSLKDGNYVGINATRQSLDSLPSTVTDLRDVPAYRLRLDCKAVAPTAAGIWHRDYAEADFVIRTPDLEDTMLGASLTTDYQALNRSLQNGPQALTLFNGFDRLLDNGIFNSDVSTAYLSLSTQLQEIQNNCSALTLKSTFGDLAFTPVNMPVYDNLGNFTLPVKGDAKTISCLAGLQCTVAREAGTHTMRRDSTYGWLIENSTWAGHASPIHILLADWQNGLGLTSPQAVLGEFSLPVFGSAFALSSLDDINGGSGVITDGHFNWDTYSANSLYAVGEAERIAYELQNSNTSAVNGKNNVFSVQASQSKQYYRITYVPIILLAGLLSTFFAALIVLYFMLSAWHTESLKQWHMVDSLRLLVDALDGISAEEKHSRPGPDDSNALKEWAKTVLVRYEKLESVEESAKLGLHCKLDTSRQRTASGHSQASIEMHPMK